MSTLATGAQSHSGDGIPGTATTMIMRQPTMRTMYVGFVESRMRGVAQRVKCPETFVRSIRGRPRGPLVLKENSMGTVQPRRLHTLSAQMARNACVETTLPDRPFIFGFISLEPC